jgi:hypothetical protein
MDPFNIKENQDWVSPPQFDAKHVNKLQEFELSIVQCNTTTLRVMKVPQWLERYNLSGFAYAEGWLFGGDNYKFCIHQIQGLPGNHCKLDTQDFQIKLQSLELNYNPNI